MMNRPFRLSLSRMADAVAVSKIFPQSEGTRFNAECIVMRRGVSQKTTITQMFQ